MHSIQKFLDPVKKKILEFIPTYRVWPMKIETINFSSVQQNQSSKVPFFEVRSIQEITVKQPK